MPPSLPEACWEMSQRKRAQAIKNQGDSVEPKEYIIRVQGVAHTYGLGEVVSPGVALFKSGHYDLTKDQLNAELKKIGKAAL